MADPARGTSRGDAPLAHTHEGGRTVAPSTSTPAGCGSAMAGIVGRSSRIDSLRSRIRAAARTRASVLITGETGTGKNLVARAIHAISREASLPFVQLDCASLDAGTIASEIFGHERGAFTGAVAQRQGRLELAGRGSLFLDEIGELDPELQVRFLRVLQERTFERVGGNQTRAFRARVLAATNRDLRREVARGRFRSDLFYRLDVLHLHMPPLRERAEDLPLLATEAARRLGRELGRAAPLLSACFEQRLARHAWPGNVRELHNIMERCLIRFEQPELTARELDQVLEDCEPTWAAHAEPWQSASQSKSSLQPPAPEHVGPAPFSSPCEEDAPGRAPSARDGERGEILRTLRETGGNVSRAARRLGLSRGTLRYRIAAYGLERFIPRD